MKSGNEASIVLKLETGYEARVRPDAFMSVTEQGVGQDQVHCHFVCCNASCSTHTSFSM